MQRSTQDAIVYAENAFQAALRKVAAKRTPANVKRLNLARESLRRARKGLRKEEAAL